MMFMTTATFEIEDIVSALCVSLFLLPQFDVSGDLLLNKGKVAWNLFVNPLLPMNDQTRISPFNINTISTK